MDTPTAIPPSASQRKSSAAAWNEKVPVSAEAIAKRRQIRPEASLRSASPSRMCIIRFGMCTRVAIADTAIGSVGDTTAASANATGRDIAGTIHRTENPMPTIVRKTKPRANCRTAQRSLSNSSFGMRQPSRNSSGGTRSRKKISGLRSTCKLVASPIAPPKAIWTSGRGIGTGSICEAKPLTTTASKRTRTIVTDSIGSLLSLAFSAKELGSSRRRPRPAERGRRLLS